MDNKKIKIAVFGDAILDLFSYYTSPRQSPEASVPIIIKQKEEYFAGGAALLATKLNELGIRVDFYSQIGSDKNSKILKSKVKDLNVFDYSKSKYQTTLKERIIVDDNYYLRKDDEMFQKPFRKSIIETFKKKASSYDAVIFSDYAKGFLSKNLFSDILEISLKKDLITFLDPNVKNKFDFNKIDYFKPNLKESIEFSKKKKIPDILRYLSKTYSTTPVITLGEVGSVSIENNKIIYSKKYNSKIVDTSGSGDIFFAYFVYSILNNNSLLRSLNYSSKEASKHVKYFGFNKK